MTIKTIIAAIALENGEQQVARRAIRLAVDHGAKLVLAHAIESLPESDPDLPAPANEEAIANVLEAEAIASLKQMAESATVQTEIEVECGKADQFIERLIRDHAADLLVIGPGKPQKVVCLPIHRNHDELKTSYFQGAGGVGVKREIRRNGARSRLGVGGLG